MKVIYLNQNESSWSDNIWLKHMNTLIRIQRQFELNQKIESQTQTKEVV